MYYLSRKTKRVNADDQGCDPEPDDDCIEKHIQSKLGSCKIPWKMPNKPSSKMFMVCRILTLMILIFLACPPCEWSPSCENNQALIADIHCAEMELGDFFKSLGG